MLQETFSQLCQGKPKPCAGILLYGLPGTGKSFLAKACATEVDATFFGVSSTDLVSRWVGESEKNVRSLFEMARASKPSIIFLDDIDFLCGSESDARIKTEFVAQMDCVEKDEEGQLLVLGATSAPWVLDTAVRRCFKKRIFLPLPELQARVRMLEITIGDTPHQVTREDLLEVASRTDNFSGADMTVLTRDAMFGPLRRTRAAKTFCRVMHEGKQMWTPCSPAAPGAVEMSLMDVRPEELLAPPVFFADFEVALEQTTSSTCLYQLEEHEKWTEQFGLDG